MCIVNKEILQIKCNYNLISVSLKWYVNKYVNGFEVYFVWNKSILNYGSFLLLFYYGIFLTKIKPS